ncbi:glycosyltransferase family 4 protein [Modestobacter sp. L9-4]|uniref:glycosyltransferase family 4 protein n=1 Tax=Modestobacter sp. L9-4 TaxID=2851567 RepID=UPI001F376E51|nr:glycosyltransferase family 4 protein [Modestobacter sp. L9-4]
MYVGHTAKLSGGEIALLRLLPALLGDVRPLVVLAEDGPLVSRLRELHIDVVVLPMPGQTRELRKERLANPLVALSRVRGILRYSLSLRKLILERRVDIVHTNTLKAGFYGCLAARLAHVPSVWHLRDRLAPDYLPRFAILATRLAISVLPAKVICNSQATLKTLSHPRLSRLRRRSAVVLASPMPDVLDSGLANVPKARDVASSEYTIGILGRISPWKGQHVVIRAFSQADLPVTARLRILGSVMFAEDAYEASLHAEVAVQGLEDRVEFVGFVDNVFEALATLDVLVHASVVPEPFGQVIVEGLAAGLPVIATRGGGPSEILTDGVDGLLYDAGDVEQLAGLIGRLYTDSSLVQRLQTNGRARARDFSPEVIGPSVISLYREMLSSRRRTAS